MKKLLRITALLLAGIITILTAAALYINYKSLPVYENLAPELTVKIDSASVAEGAKIGMMLCAHCHSSDDGKLGGALMEKSALGEIYAPNITQHPEYGTTQYTAGELAYLLRTGIRKDGGYAPPWMTKLPHLSDEDLHNIIAFLRSDHPLVQPSDNDPPPTKYSFLAKFLLTMGIAKPLPYPEQEIKAPSPSDQVAYGRYLAVAKYDCYGCHSKDFSSINLMEPEKTEGFFGGGNAVLDRNGNTVISKNLTMDEATGLGDWMEAEFIRALKYGQLPSGKTISNPMIPYAHLTDEEAAAIWAYLQTIPVIKNEDLLMEPDKQAAMD